MSWKLGSLFDGSGGFPLAGLLCDIEPRWASEVEPYPIAVTRSRFPNMKHLGDISKVNGADVEPVDIITFGSPCQDLSVAGKRAGLKHEANGDEETTRSGLFMEAVRIIKEMKEATNGEYPRFALWENVPGAFSSNKGEDFRVVLEELIKIVEPAAVMPEVPKNGWAYADSYVGNGWSIAYRVFDAQYWGVPQRRRRIHLVADLRGTSAREVLFEREGVRGYFAKGGTAWESLAAYAEGGSGATDREGVGLDLYNHALTGDVAATLTSATGQGPINSGPSVLMTQMVLDDQGGQQISVRTDGKTPTLRAEMHGNVPCVMEAAGFCTEHSAKARGVGFQKECAPTLRAGVTPALVYSVENHPADSRVSIDESGKVQTLTGRMGTGGGNVPMIMEPIVFAQNQREEVRDLKGISGGLSAEPGSHQQTYVAVPVAYNGENITSPLNKTNPQPGDPCHTLGTDSRNYVVIPIHDQATRFSGKRGDKADGKGNGLGIGNDGDPMNTLTSGDRHAVVYAETYQKVTGPLMANSHPGSYSGQDAYNDMFVVGKEYAPIALDRAFFNQGQNALYDPQLYEDGSNPTLVARGPNAVCVRYIVRRLTPTECARLQGFADRWGEIEEKEDFTDEEWTFWAGVRNTHAEINGKETKSYTKAQMLTWYNKLRTDSSEYKMWGNGIALPPAVYCMQGISDVLKKTEEK